MTKYLFFNQDTQEVYITTEAPTEQDALAIWAQKCGYDGEDFEAHVKERIAPATLGIAICGGKGSVPDIYSKIRCVAHPNNYYAFYLTERRRIYVELGQQLTYYLDDFDYYSGLYIREIIPISSVPLDVLEYVTKVIAAFPPQT